MADDDEQGEAEKKDESSEPIINNFVDPNQAEPPEREQIDWEGRFREGEKVRAEENKRHNQEINEIKGQMNKIKTGKGGTSGTGDAGGPYRLRKLVVRDTKDGRPAQIPMKIPNIYLQNKPISEVDIPEEVIVQYGPGEYVILDAADAKVGTILIKTADKETITNNPPPQGNYYNPYQQQPYGQYYQGYPQGYPQPYGQQPGMPGMPGTMPWSMEELRPKEKWKQCIEAFEYAKTVPDRQAGLKMAQAAMEAYEMALKSEQGGGGDFLDKSLKEALVNRLKKDMEGVISGAVNPATGGGTKSKEEIELLIRQQALAEKKEQFKEITEMVDKGLNTVMSNVEKFLPPRVDNQQLSAKAAELSGAGPSKINYYAPPGVSGQKPVTTPDSRQQYQQVYQPQPQQQAPPQQQYVQPAPVQASPNMQEPDPAQTITCTRCKQTMPLQDYILHLDQRRCNLPSQPQQSQPVAQQPSNPPAQPNQGDIAMAPQDMKLTEETKGYLRIVPSLTGYITGYTDKTNPNLNFSPKNIADATWMLLQTNEANKNAVLGVVREGYDKQIEKVKSAGILDFINGFPTSLSPDPATRDRQINTLLEVFVLTDIVKNENLGSINADNIQGFVNQLKSHMVIQMSPVGRKWICEYLNEIAIKANMPQPHPEYLGGSNKGTQYL